MKAFTDKQALELGKSILERFEEGLNGKKWMGTAVTLPFQLDLKKGTKLEYPRDSEWCSNVTMSIPYFFRTYGPSDYEQITLDEWLKEK